MTAVTYADICRIPETNAFRYEIIGGELFVSSSPPTTHQRVSFRLTRAFDRAIVAPGHGELFYALVDVKFSEYDVAVPDLLVVATDHRETVQERYFEGLA
jgi:hypothetical protein